MSAIRGWVGEKITALGMWLTLSKKTYRRFHDVIVPAEDGTTQIDHVLVSPYGIFVIETKNMKGWIFGSADRAKWTQSLFGKKYSFQNPLRQNFRHTKCLAGYLGIDHELLHSVVFFIGDATFKTKMPPNVMRSGISSYIKEHRKKLLSKEEVERICGLLANLKADPSLTTRAHLQSLRERHGSKTASASAKEKSGRLPQGSIPAENKSEDMPLELIRFDCPECNQTIEAPESSAGQTATCPTCSADLIIPDTISAPVVHEINRGRKGKDDRILYFGKLSMRCGKIAIISSLTIIGAIIGLPLSIVGCVFALIGFSIARFDRQKDLRALGLGAIMNLSALAIVIVIMILGKMVERDKPGSSIKVPITNQAPVASTPAAPLSRFEFLTKDEGIEIKRYIGPAGPVIIPDTIDGTPVTSIGSFAFNPSIIPMLRNGSQPGTSSRATYVRISDNVTHIGNSAFFMSSNLEQVVFGKGLKTMGQSVFRGCTRLKEIIIPYGVTALPKTIFSGCMSLRKITIPESVTSIGTSAFAKCESLISVTLPSSLEVIDSYAFKNCKRLKRVIFQGLPPKIGIGAFSGTPSIFYYDADYTQWGDELGGRPTKPIR